MAREFKLLSVLWLVAACIADSTTTDTPTTTPVPTTTAAPTTTPVPTTTAAPTTTPVPTTTAAPTTTPVPTTTAAPTTTTVPTTTAAPTTPGPTTTAAPATPDPTTTAAPTTTPVPTTTAAPTTPGPTTTAAPATTPGPTTTAAPATTPGPTTTAAPATTPGPTTTAPATPGPTTTAAPATTPGPTTTAAGTTPGPTTTAAPATTPGLTTTAAPATTPGPTTTAAPATTPGPTTTAAGTTPGPTTTAAPATTPGLTTTAAPATTPGLTTTTTKFPDPCEVDPCGDGSTCDPRANQDFVCLCLAGDFYNNISKSCVNAKVFPGQLDLPNLVYHPEMSSKTSPEFQNASQKIIDELLTVFAKSVGYSGSTVLELQPNSNVRARSETGVNASVEITFTANSDIKTTDVTEAIKNGTKCEGCLLENATFRDEDLCNKNACDGNTAECLSKDGSYQCSCKENYIKTNFSSRMCIACPSGQKAEGSKCVNCQFGYSGFNCSESWQLTLVIVGSVLGGLLLITLILLPIVASKCSKKSSKKNKNADIGKPYISHSPVKAPLVNHSLANSQAAPVNGSANGLAAYANAGGPRIPRATTTTSWDNRTNLEMTPSNSRQNLVPVGRNSRLYEDPDDRNPYAQARPQSSLYAQAQPQNNPYAQARAQNNPYAQAQPQNNPYAQARAQNNPYAQARAQNNPYAQNRPQINPYASNQGQTNPNYMHDDGRRFN